MNGLRTECMQRSGTIVGARRAKRAARRTNGVFAAWLLCFAGCGAFCGTAHAWGAHGHETVGAIADRLISGRRAEGEVRRLLAAGQTLQSVSTWADCARDECGRLSAEDRQFARRNPDQAHYHYTDVPFQAQAYVEHAVGTSDDDVVHILKECIQVLKGARGAGANPHQFSQREALLLLVHLMGDLHQPLHVGGAYMNDRNEFVEPASQASVDGVKIFRADGDNDLIFESRPLHSFWDTRAVTEAMERSQVRSPAQFADVLMRAAPNLPIVNGDVTKWPAKWASETLGVSKEAHRGLVVEDEERRGGKGGSRNVWRVRAPQDYPERAAALTATQLTRAGYRLAAVLEAVWH